MSSFTTPLEYEYSHYDSKKRRKVYRLSKPFRYRIGSYDEPFAIISVPEGFETDFASIPWPICQWFKPEGPWSKAAVVHDFMLVIIKNNGLKHSRIVADTVFYEAMRVSGVNPAIAWVFFKSVRMWSILQNFKG